VKYLELACSGKLLSALRKGEGEGLVGIGAGKKTIEEELFPLTESCGLC
jgi:hypothetical protein